MADPRCWIGKHSLFPIGYAVARCRRCRHAFHVDLSGPVTRLTEAPALTSWESHTFLQEKGGSE